MIARSTAGRVSLMDITTSYRGPLYNCRGQLEAMAPAVRGNHNSTAKNVAPFQEQDCMILLQVLADCNPVRLPTTDSVLAEEISTCIPEASFPYCKFSK